MAATPSPISIGIYGYESADQHGRHGCGLWQAGHAAVVTAAGAQPVMLDPSAAGSWGEVLDGLHGVVLIGSDSGKDDQLGEGPSLCEWSRKHHFPLLAIDHGMHVLNETFGGNLFRDLPRDLPDALQHRHPPEKGVRHSIAVEQDSRLCAIYGEGEIVVNSEHRRAVQKIARGFRVSARALDGVVEAIEAENPQWFAVGVQWHPASGTASGLDIQLFRGLVDATSKRPIRSTSHSSKVFAA